MHSVSGVCRPPGEAGLGLLHLPVPRQQHLLRVLRKKWEMCGHVTKAAESLAVTSWLSVQVQNEQCQEMVQSDDQKWIKVTNNGEWGTHTVSASRGQCLPLSLLVGALTTSCVCRCFQVSLKSGMNILYWRTTGILVGGKKVKPVLLRNIQIEGEHLV